MFDREEIEIELSERSGEVVQVVGLGVVNEEQAGPPETGSEVVQVVFADGVVVLIGVDKEQPGLLEKARTSSFQSYNE